MNLDRLQHQIAILRRVEEQHLAFNMGSWIEREACGTVACAFGYAALDPLMQAAGLSLRVYLGGDVLGNTIHTIEEYNERLKGNTGLRCTPCFAGSMDYEAAAEFYDITKSAAAYLFDPDSYPNRSWKITPGDVIDRVQRVIKNDGACPRITA